MNLVPSNEYEVMEVIVARQGTSRLPNYIHQILDVRFLRKRTYGESCIPGVSMCVAGM